MKKSELKFFVGRKAKINVWLGERDYFYSGTVKKLNSDSLTFIDKYNMTLFILYDKITKIEEADVVD